MNRNLRKSPSLKNFFLWFIIGFIFVYRSLFFTLLPDLYSHFAIYFWLLQVLFWGFELQSNKQKIKKYKENFLAIFVSALIFLWFFYWSDFFCRICCSLKKVEYLLQKVLITVDCVNSIQHGFKPLDSPLVSFLSTTESFIFGVFVNGEKTSQNDITGQIDLAALLAAAMAFSMDLASRVGLGLKRNHSA